MKEIIEKFEIASAPIEWRCFGSGNINDTYRVTCEDGSQYALQRINHNVFSRPDQVMENVIAVTKHIRRKTLLGRKTLQFIQSRDGKYYYRDKDGNWWRMYEFITNCVSLQKAESAKDLKEGARGFGHFMNQLSDFPAETLHETIPGFHNTPARFRRFHQLIEKDPAGRGTAMAEDIAFLLEREEKAAILMNMLASGKLPLRVTHNDTKLDNVLLHEATRRAYCVIDLDTVMPGLSVIDFGDAVRFGASMAAEDERDLSKVGLDLKLVEAYAAGYLGECGDTLTDNEKKMLPLGIWTITLELGMRFLTDYLEGDVYFKTSRPEHNLDRWRTQMTLVKDIESKWFDLLYVIYRHC